MILTLQDLRRILSEEISESLYEATSLLDDVENLRSYHPGTSADIYKGAPCFKRTRGGTKILYKKDGSSYDDCVKSHGGKESEKSHHHLDDNADGVVNWSEIDDLNLESISSLVKEAIDMYLIYEQEGTDIDVDTDEDPDWDPRRNWASRRAGREAAWKTPDPEPPAVKLAGGPITRFLDEPVASGRYNFSYDEATMKSMPDGGVDQDDPRAISPGMGHKKVLFVVDADSGGEYLLEPRAALQNDLPHDGNLSQDIFGVIGDPVPAYINGYVHYAEDQSPQPGGNAVVLATAAPVTVAEDPKDNIYPADTEFVRYAHLDSFSVSTGDIVSAGTIIGELGCTGNCGTLRTFPHIHLSVMGTDSKGRYNYSRKNRNAYDIFLQSGWGDRWITSSKDLYHTNVTKP